MDDLMTNLGIPTIVVIMILRAIVPLLKSNNKNSNGKSNGHYVTKDEHDRVFDLFQRKDTCNEVVKRIDGRFDDVDKTLSRIEKKVDNGNE